MVFENISVAYEVDPNILSEVLDMIRENIDAIKNLDMKTAKINERYLYFGVNDRFVLAVLSLGEDERLILAINLALKNISAIQNINLIDSNVTIKGKAKRVIFHSLSHLPPSSRLLWKLADDIINATTTAKTIKNIGVDKLHLFMGETKSESLKRSSFAKKSTMDRLVRAFFDGDFKFIVEHAPSVFGEGDLPKIIYAVAALNLNSFDPKVRAPSLEKIKGVVLEIEDSLTREYMLLNIRAYIRPVGESEKIDILLSDKRRLLEKIENGGSFEAEVYSFLLSDAPLRDVLSFLLQKFSKVSRYLQLRIINKIYTIKIREETPPHTSLWLKLLKKFITYSIRASKKNDELAYHQLVILQKILVWGLSSMDMDPEILLEKFRFFIEYEQKYHEKILHRSKRVPNELRTDSINMTFNIIFNILLDTVPNSDAELLIKNYWDVVISLIKWLVALRYKKRIQASIYQIVVSGLIGLVVKMAAKKGVYVENIPFLVREIAEYYGDIHADYDFDTYVHVYLGMVEALTYTAIMFPRDIRTRILNELFNALRELVFILSEKNFLRSIILIRLLEILTLIETEDSKSKRQQVKEDYWENMSPFFRSYAQKIMQK